jgi:uncharacterized transporter YbjL
MKRVQSIVKAIVNAIIVSLVGVLFAACVLKLNRQNSGIGNGEREPLL